MITGINESKTLTKDYHVNVNINLMEQNITQISFGKMINVHVSVKKFMYVKKYMFGILLHAIVKMENT